MIIVGNFKSHLVAKEDAEAIAKACAKHKTKHTLVLAPSFVHLGYLAAKKIGVALSAQDVSVFEDGSHTGEVSAMTVSNSGAKYTLVGHSERRAGGETNSIVATKICQALDAKLKVILCLGEEERDMHATYLAFIAEQIVSALKVIKESDFKNIIIAYEPVWAIGKGSKEVITKDHLEETVLFIKKILHEQFGEKSMKAVKILYGGSVSAQNVHELLAPGVDGFLVGRASSSKESFLELIDAIDA